MKDTASDAADSLRR
jgi:hypothetical protein